MVLLNVYKPYKAYTFDAYKEFATIPLISFIPFNLFAYFIQSLSSILREMQDSFNDTSKLEQSLQCLFKIYCQIQAKYRR